MGKKVAILHLAMTKKARVMCVLSLLMSAVSFAATTLSAITNDGTLITTSSVGVLTSTLSANTNGATSEYGFLYHTSALTLTSPTTGASGTGTYYTISGSLATSSSFTATLTGLTAGQRYYVYPYVKIGTSYYYRTTAFSIYTLHTVTTGSSSTVDVNFATLGGTVTAGSGTTITAKGIVYSTSANPTLSNSVATHSSTASGGYSVVVSGLTGGTTYYYRAYVTSNCGTSYGSDATFTTVTPPTVTYSSLPLSDNFTSSLGTNWAARTTNASSIVAVVSAGGAWPQFGTTTDANGNTTSGGGLGVYNTSAIGGNQKQMAMLGLNLSNKTGVTVGFSIVDWGTGGGVGQYWDSIMVYLSVDGGYTYGSTGTYIPMNQAPYSDGIWNNVSLDISALATTKSLTPSATSVVKFVFNLAGSNDVTKPKNTGISNSQMMYIDNLVSSNTGTLPVNLVSFDVSKEQGGNLLTWTTASEINNDHFEIQYSEDGISFITIGYVAGQGTSYQINNYSFFDERSFNGTVYYRLKQVDFDGTTSYSNTISLGNAQAISLFKSGDNTISINGENLTGVEVFDMNGKLIYSDILNKNLAAQTVHFDAASIAQGVYFVRVLSGNQSFSQKLVY